MRAGSEFAFRASGADAVAVVEARARAAEQRLAALSAATGAWLWRTDAEGRLVWASEALCALTGAPLSALIGRRLAEALGAMAGPEGADGLDRIARSLAGMRPFRDEALALDAAPGGGRRLSLSGAPLRDGSGRICGMEGAAVDVTALRAAEDAAERANRRLREGVEAAPAGFALFDAEGRLVLCNSLYREVMDDCAPPREGEGEAPTFESIVRRAVDQGARYGCGDGAAPEEVIAARVARFRAADGAPVEVRVRDGRWFEMIERRTPSGDVACLRLDVTARRTAETRLRDAFDRAPVGLAMFDADDRLVMWNDRYVEFYPEAKPHMRPGVSFADLALLSGARLTMSGREDEIRDWFQRRMALRHGGGKPFVHNNHSGRSILVTETRMADGGIIGLHVDISAMVLLQEELALAKRRSDAALQARTRFLADMSHELRTPLNAVIGYAEMIAQGAGGDLDPRYVEFAERIKESGRFLLSLIVDVLDMSKIEAGAMPVNCAAVDAGPAIAEAVAMLAPQAQARGVALDCAVAPDLPPVWAERRRLVQIVQNLTSNAVKFTAEGRVSVTAEAVDGMARIVVADTGRGMDAEEIELALTPFQQVGGATSGDYLDGTGLGLPLVRAMVALQNGAFAIDSAPGRGTRVTVSLPLADPRR